MTRGTASSGMPTERLTTQLWTMDEASEEWKPMFSAIYFYLSNANAVYNARFRPGEINHGPDGPILWWRHGRMKILVGYIATQCDRNPYKATEEWAGPRSNADGQSANCQQEALWRKKWKFFLSTHSSRARLRQNGSQKSFFHQGSRRSQGKTGFL